MKEFEVHKGLQKPLVFKGVKGKFIYWLGGGVLGSFILTIISNFLFGILGAIIVFLAGLGVTFGSIKHFQKKGLHKKDNTKGIIFHKSVYKNKYEKV